MQSIVVTPSDKSIAVGQKQSFTAMGTFSNGSTRALGAAIGNLAPGNTDTCVLLISGGVDCWGQNGDGELGTGNTTDSLIARPVKWISTATSVAFGGGHGCALLVSGAVQCWGRNDSGQLGNGTLENSSTPVRVAGIRSATALAAGEEHSCALVANGAIECWGENFYGDLGDGTNVRSSIPVRVTAISTATAVAVGNGDSCALLASGKVQCWGINLYGQLGNGTTTDANVPVTVSGINNATAIAAGGNFNCALLATGAVQCWGHNGNAELGDGSSWPYANSSTPVPVVGISTATSITAGAYHACAVLLNGSALCWGYNNYGQLGDGTTTASASITPVRVCGISAPARLAAGFWHTCALLSDGAMKCWGSNNEGQLGNRRRTSYTPNRWPVNVVGTPGVVWSSSDPSKATISGRGLAAGRAAGNTTITATTPGLINDNAVLTVK